MDRFPEYTTIVFPDPTKLQKPISWGRAVATLSKRPSQFLNQPRHPYLEAARAHPSPAVQEKIAALLAEDRIIPKIQIILLGAAMSGDLTVYVTAGDHSCFFEITMQAWGGEAYPFTNPVSMACSGYFSTNVPPLPPTLAIKVGSAPLFLEETNLLRISSLNRHPSESQLKRSAAELVENVINSEPKMRIKKGDFFARMKLTFPNASTNSIGKIWKSKIIPEHWRNPGRW